MWDCMPVEVLATKVATEHTLFITVCIIIGSISISGVTFDPDLLILTCISTGGPATAVTWTRGSTTVTERNETVLDDPVTAQYNHTLSIGVGVLRGEYTGGKYTCTVTNDRPSSDSTSITIPGIIFGLYALLS